MKPTLNPNARKLVAALRSGRYKQGRGQLHRASDDRRCCLGVACDLYQKEVGGLRIEKSDEHDAFFYDGESGILPAVVMEWLGLREERGQLGEHFLDCLAAKNDSGASFRQIADIIERKPDGLFVEGK